MGQAKNVRHTIGACPKYHNPRICSPAIGRIPSISRPHHRTPRPATPFTSFRGGALAASPHPLGHDRNVEQNNRGMSWKCAKHVR